ncbi:MAG: DUF115 domain-containing protein, partial [Spirochaetales bacterium]
MPVSILLERNLAIFPAFLAQMIRSAVPRFSCETVEARDGSPNLQVSGPDRAYLLHSRYAPTQEADRIASTVPPGATAVVIGAGAGYHLEALLPVVERLLVIETDPALFRAGLELRDLTGVLGSPRTALLLTADLGEIREFVTSSYMPALDGPLVAVELPGRTGIEPEVFAGVWRAVSDATEAIKDDAAIQVRFGARWVRNTFLNYAQPASEYPSRWSDAQVIVAAAGPSLADSAAWLRGVRPASPILSVDTALPVLIANGITPTAAIAIDCQLYSYHHFLTAGAVSVPLLAELSTLPSLFRKGGLVTPVLGGHPLHGLLNRLGSSLMTVDTSGGNVTHAALSTARGMGAKSAILVGADLSYPDAETYPRGSYLFPHFGSSSLKTLPQAGSHLALLFDRPGLFRDPDQPGRYRQAALESYRRRLEHWVRVSGFPVSARPGRGVPLDMPTASCADDQEDTREPELGTTGSVDGETPRNDGHATRRRIVETIVALWSTAGDAADARRVL